MNHKAAVFLCFTALMLVLAVAAGPAADDIDEHRSCSHCGEGPIFTLNRTRPEYLGHLFLSTIFIFACFELRVLLSFK